MTKATRVAIAILLVAAGLASVPGAAAGQVAGLNISIEGNGPFAPGTPVTVVLSALAGEQYAQVQQCDVGGAACGSAAFVELDEAGSGSVVVRIRRYLPGATGVVDCAVSPCVLAAQVFSGDEASVPIEVDGTVRIVRPTATVTPSTAIADRGTVTVAGRGFEAGTFVQISECAWTDDVRCLPGSVGFAQAASNGTFSTRVPVLRIVAGTDCAARRGLCQLWVAPEGNIDHLVAVGLGFDPTSTPQLPVVVVQPSTGLRHEQSVAVTGADFIDLASVTIEQCVDRAPLEGNCRYLASASAGNSGSFQTNVVVRRRVGVDDCAIARCFLRANSFPLDQIDVPIAFDASIPPPPAPSVAVEPSTDLVDRQVVDVQLRDIESGSFVELQLCSAGAFDCRAQVSQSVEGPAATIPMALPRLLGSGSDCAVIACELRIQLYGEESYSFAVPVSFDPDAPLAGSADVRVLPANGLWDRQAVEVRGERLDPGAFFALRQCTDPDASAGNCAPASDASVDSRGDLSAQFSVRRTLRLPEGEHDCASVACYLVVGSDPPVALALTFDPNGPLRGSDLPAQLECVSWPTEQWPVGEVPEGVDAARVAQLGEQMVGTNGGDSVVVIHGGKLVYENYADGVTPDSVLPSFSMSKSFTSTIVGLLVQEGQLALDERAPIEEWSAPDDPRNAITLRNILHMASGLEWDESYSDPASDVIQMVVSPDNAAYVIAKPLQNAPGSQFHYSTGDTMVLAKIIGDTAGVSGDTYASYLHDRLLDPLGITPVAPGFDAAGTWRGGYQTNTTTRNFAKLGLLYLRDGVWEDEQFLSSDWVDFVRTPGPSSGYGGQFWLNGDGSFSMIGLYGQSVQIVPQLDLIVAVNNGGGGGQMVDLFRNAEKPSCGEPAALAVDDSASVTALKSVDIDVLGNDTGGAAGLAAATLTVSDPPAHGMADVVNDRIRYRSDTGFTGTDTLAYVVCTTDREDCVEAEVSVEVQPLAFEFRPPVTDGTNRRTPGRAIYVPFRTPPGQLAVASVASVAVECASGAVLGDREPVVADLHARVKGGRVWCWWSTSAAWIGCRDLEITLADGHTHAAHFAWRARSR